MELFLSERMRNTCYHGNVLGWPFLLLIASEFRGLRERDYLQETDPKPREEKLDNNITHCAWKQSVLDWRYRGGAGGNQDPRLCCPAARFLPSAKVSSSSKTRSAPGTSSRSSEVRLEEKALWLAKVAFLESVPEMRTHTFVQSKKKKNKIPRTRGLVHTILND